MIASTIGRTFLKAYNNKTGNNYTAKEFFEKEYFEYFYNHSKYMQWVTNSPFVQELSSDPKGNYGVRNKFKGEDGKTKTFGTDEEAKEFYNKSIITRNDFLYCYDTSKKKLSKKGIEFIKTLNEDERKKKLDDFNKKAKSSAIKNEYDGSIAIGFPASEVDNFPVASGQVTDIKVDYSIDDIYFSWIGSGLGIGLAGAYTLYFDNPQLLYSIYEGWKVYRKLLNDRLIQHQAKQIDTWNGQWLAYRYDKYYKGDNDYVTLQNHKNQIFNVTDEGVVFINTITWSKLMFGISRTIQNPKILGFIGSFSKTNKTLGFYPFHFDKAKTLILYYKKLFGEKATINDAKEYEELFGLKLHKACQAGVIGLRALQPISLYDDILKDKKINAIKFKTYKTWLTAMINKEETLELTGEIANKLHLFEEGSKGTDRRALIEKLLKSGKKDFLNKWVEIVEKIPINERKEMKSISDKVYFMSQEEYGYFIALLQLDYRYQEDK